MATAPNNMSKPVTAGIVRPEDFEFLIEIKRDGQNVYYLQCLHDREVLGTYIMSAAQPFDYRGAQRVCQGLRAHGFKQAVVTDLTGAPVTAATFGNAALPKPASSLPATLDELRQIPVREQRRRFNDDPQFRKVVEQLESSQ
jgi:hypothetical protein